jgi:hypothetical protein
MASEAYVGFKVVVEDQDGCVFELIPQVPVSEASDVVPLLISGLPKSGTTWVQNMINQMPSAVVFDEFGLYVPWLLKVDEVSSATDNPPPFRRFSVFGGRPDFAMTHALSNELLSWISSSGRFSIVGDKQPLEGINPDWLLSQFERWPGMRYIHCMRNPLDCIISRLYHEASLLRHVDPALLSQSLSAATYKIVASGALDDLRHPVLTPTPELTEFVVHNCAGWNSSARALATLMDVSPEHVMVARYEAMLDDLPTFLIELARFIGLSPGGAQVDKIANPRHLVRNGVAGDGERFLPAEIKMVARLALDSDLLARMGYDLAVESA